MEHCFIISPPLLKAAIYRPVRCARVLHIPFYIALRKYLIDIIPLNSHSEVVSPSVLSTSMQERMVGQTHRESPLTLVSVLNTSREKFAMFLVNGPAILVI